MRLGQLARQLEIKPDEIVKFLSSRNITIDSGNNARIDDLHAELVIRHFAPDRENLVHQIAQEPDLPEAEPERLLEIEPEGSSEVSEIPEVIKAPKIELPGLRVLGKIELPEKKKPGPETKEEELSTAPSPPRYKRNSPPPRKWNNPITLAREKEEREKKENLKEEREREKQRRTEFYMKRLKPQPPTKQVRMVQEETIEMPALGPERPKTAWGRFMRWLNT